MAGLTEFYCRLNETSHASQFKWLEYTFKGTVPRDFSLHVLFMNPLLQAPDINKSVVTNFFEIYIFALKMHHQFR
jgi:hypothetical protein